MHDIHQNVKECKNAQLHRMFLYNPSSKLNPYFFSRKHLAMISFKLFHAYF